MPDLRFIKLAVDPTLIPGVYNGCDQWCDYCPVTARCLAFKCRPPLDGGDDIYHNIAEAMFASMQYLKECHGRGRAHRRRRGALGRGRVGEGGAARRGSFG